MALTVRGLESLKPGKWLSESGRRNEGALRAKGSASGVRLYFRYRNSAGRYDDLPIGSFHAGGVNGMSYKAAKDRAAELRARYLAGDRDLRVSLRQEAQETVRMREAAARDHEAGAKVARATLGVLLAAYVEQLKVNGKNSAPSVEKALHRHVRDAWPSLWATPVKSIGVADLLSITRKLARAGKLRESDKVRTYLRAAFSAAIRASQDTLAIPALSQLEVTSNPARDLATIPGANKARERALSIAELRAYWKRIAAMPSVYGAMLQFHLLTGGQRIAQIARATTTDLDRDSHLLKLRDGKGRRKVARVHEVPLTPAAIESLKAMRGGDLGPYLLTVDAGASGVAYSTVQHRVRAVSAAMALAGELENGAFTPGDLRRTVETRLAAAGVSMEVRAQLQSHGLGGLQARHYDKHRYNDEKRAALETLHQLLTGKAATVTAIKSNRGASHSRA